MINVASLRPSDIERLIEDGFSDEDKKAILSSLRTMLLEVRPDGGADSDRIYMAAQMLEMAGAWEQIAVEDLVETISGAPFETIQVFLEGLPHTYGAELAFKMMTDSSDLSTMRIVKQAYERQRVLERVQELEKAWRLTNLASLDVSMVGLGHNLGHDVISGLVTPHVPQISTDAEGNTQVRMAPKPVDDPEYAFPWITDPILR